jgi:putative flippase GtrA
MSLRRLSEFEIVRYAAISAVAFIVDITLLTLLTQFAGLHYLLAATCSFLAGGVVAYLLSIRYVFRYRRLQDQRVEAMTFVALGLAGLLVNTGVMALLVGKAAVHVLVAKVVASAATFGVNFLLRKSVLFAPVRATSE